MLVFFGSEGIWNRATQARGGRVRPLPVADEGSTKKWQEHSEFEQLVCDEWTDVPTGSRSEKSLLLRHKNEMIFTVGKIISFLAKFA